MYRMLNYNEDKVDKGIAMCIASGNYPFQPEQMGIGTKLGYMNRLMELNHRAELKAMHISLNFSPSETDLTKERLTAIADAFMQGIGFGKQPYLVYQHYDAGHPHVHIVTTTVRRDGSHINTYMIGKKKSEPIRKNIEQEFGLVRAEKQDKTQQYRPEPVSPSKVQYGRSETKTAIQNVLGHVLSKYRYSSLSELNAVLGLYNVRAEQGEESSRVLQHGGLLYRILDPTGKPTGVPIKASLIYNTPTLKKLEENFNKNAERSPSHQARVRSAVYTVLKGRGIDLKKFAEELSSKGIDLVIRKNEQGFVYGLTYVDHITRNVFNGSSLGKRYSAKAVQERCMLSQLESKGIGAREVQMLSPKISHGTNSTDTTLLQKSWTSDHTSSSLFSDLLDCLFTTEYTPEYIPYELRQQKKKKKKKRSIHH